MKVHCGMCDGEGDIARECLTCKGTGWADGEECAKCDNDGYITEGCLHCNGEGTLEISIEALKLTRDTKHYAELLPLQEDAKRTRKQAAQLIHLRPERAESYQAQLSATLAEINRQAEEIVNPKTKRR